MRLPNTIETLFFLAFAGIAALAREVLIHYGWGYYSAFAVSVVLFLLQAWLLGLALDRLGRNRRNSN
jgi:hypothetical protein